MVTGISYPTASLNVTYGYDQGTFGIGRLTSATDAGGVRTFTYDARGNLTSQTHTAGGQTKQILYVYTLGDEVSQVGYLSGNQAVYTRNAQGRVTGIVLNGQTVLSGRTYDAAGATKTQTWGNSLFEQKSYDLDGRLTTWSVGYLLTQGYTYDLAGNITVMGGIGLGYDALDRLTSSPAFRPEIPTALRRGSMPRLSRFGGFLLLAALLHRSLHRLSGHRPALRCSVRCFVE